MLPSASCVLLEGSVPSQAYRDQMDCAHLDGFVHLDPCQANRCFLETILVQGRLIKCDDYYWGGGTTESLKEPAHFSMSCFLLLFSLILCSSSVLPGLFRWDKALAIFLSAQSLFFPLAGMAAPASRSFGQCQAGTFCPTGSYLPIPCPPGRRNTLVPAQVVLFIYLSYILTLLLPKPLGNPDLVILVFHLWCLSNWGSCFYLLLQVCTVQLQSLQLHQVPVRLASTAQGAPRSQTLWVVQWGTSVLEVTSVLQEVPLHLRVPQVGLTAAAAYQHFPSQCFVSCWARLWLCHCFAAPCYFALKRAFMLPKGQLLSARELSL